MESTLNKLLVITDGCREDMHEPDNQGIDSIISGTHLDNAHGNTPCSNEFVITISRDNKVEHFNLATLIALARKADLTK
jgi:hypothetical protein